MGIKNSISALLATLAIFSIIVLLANYSTMATALYKSLTLTCTTGNLCQITKVALSPVADLIYLNKRNALTKQELPIVNIYIDDGVVKKIQAKRTATLSKPGSKQVLTLDDSDWSKAKIILDDGTKKSMSVRLRLKGDWTDHINEPNKLSFRIKITDKEYFFGMKRFSIQHPKTRGYQVEPLLLDHMRSWGLLAPKYFFVDVRVNDRIAGIMAVEEHFSKELLEAQNRREGSILARGESLHWGQLDLNFRNRVPHPTQYALQYSPWDHEVKEYREPKFLSGTIATNNSIRAQSLLRDFLDGKQAASETFDTKQIAMWWVLANVWNGCHALGPINKRFYHNPISDLLEPIAFDHGWPPSRYSTMYPSDSERTTTCRSYDVDTMLSDKTFQKYVLTFAELLHKQLSDPTFQTTFLEKQKQLLRALSIEGMDSKSTYPATYPTTLLNNLQLFTTFLKTDFQLPTVNRSQTTTRVVQTALTNGDYELFTHLTGYLYRTESPTLYFKNLTQNAIEINSIQLVAAKGQSETLPIGITLPADDGLSDSHIVEIPASLTLPVASVSQTSTNYSYLGNSYTKTNFMQHRNHSTGFSTVAIPKLEGILVDHDTRSVTFTKKSYEINESYSFPVSYSVTISPGTTINLTNGALLRLNGPLYAEGQENDPIVINIESNPGLEPMGSWGGILVNNASSTSIIKYTSFIGDGNSELPNRQDFRGLTGCITFHESDVKISNSSYDAMQCEDAQNIVRSNFTISDTTFSRVSGDAFDADFSIGVISESSFAEIGNDGIDISGSELALNQVSLHRIGDKGISVGEKSTLYAEHIEIRGAITGVASKDLSFAELKHVNFSQIQGSVLMAYIKKDEYGPAKIVCNECSIDTASPEIASQQTSEIILNGTKISQNRFSDAQLIEAGYIIEKKTPNENGVAVAKPKQ